MNELSLTLMRIVCLPKATLRTLIFSEETEHGILIYDTLALRMFRKLTDS